MGAQRELSHLASTQNSFQARVSSGGGRECRDRRWCGTGVNIANLQPLAQLPCRSCHCRRRPALLPITLPCPCQAGGWSVTAPTIAMQSKGGVQCKCQVDHSNVSSNRLQLVMHAACCCPPERRRRAVYRRIKRGEQVAGVQRRPGKRGVKALTAGLHALVEVAAKAKQPVQSAQLTPRARAPAPQRPLAACPRWLVAGQRAGLHT